MRDWGDRDERWRGIRSQTVSITTSTHASSPTPAGTGPATEVHLLRAGPDTAEGVLPTLLVHGLGGNATNWLDVMGQLGAAGPVVAVDLPGFGRTEPPHPRAARLQPQARFLDRLLDTLGWDRAVVHGNSMGGLLAVLLAAARPGRVERLVLTSPALPPPRSPSGMSPAAALRFAPFVSQRLGGLVVGRVYARTPAERIRRGTMDLVLGEVDDLRPSMRQVQLENVEMGKVEAWRAPSFARAAADLVATLGRAGSVHRVVVEVEAPTLLVWGEQDRLVSRATMDAVVARRPDWRRVDMPGVGHVAMLEAPDRWLDIVAAAARSGQ